VEQEELFFGVVAVISQISGGFWLLHIPRAFGGVVDECSGSPPRIGLHLAICCPGRVCEWEYCLVKSRIVRGPGPGR